MWVNDILSQAVSFTKGQKLLAITRDGAALIFTDENPYEQASRDPGEDIMPSGPFSARSGKSSQQVPHVLYIAECLCIYVSQSTTLSAVDNFSLESSNRHPPVPSPVSVMFLLA